MDEHEWPGVPARRSPQTWQPTNLKRAEDNRSVSDRWFAWLRARLAPDQLAPAVAVAADHLVRRRRADGARIVEVDAGRGFPDLEDGLDQLPGAIDGVAAVEQRGVAAHAVEQEALVGLRDRALEGVGVGHGHE